MRYTLGRIGETIVTFKDAYADKTISVYSERPCKDGFDFIEIILPSYEIIRISGYNEDEKSSILEFIKKTEDSIYSTVKTTHELHLRSLIKDDLSKYFYSEVHGVITTYSPIDELKNGLSEYILVEHKKGDKIALYSLPDYVLIKSFGFDESELFKLGQYTENNAPLLWQLAREGYDTNANAI